MKVICPNRTEHCDAHWTSPLYKTCVHKTPHECNVDSRYCLSLSICKGVGGEGCFDVCVSTFGEIFKEIVKEEEKK